MVLPDEFGDGVMRVRRFDQGLLRLRVEHRPAGIFGGQRPCFDRVLQGNLPFLLSVFASNVRATPVPSLSRSERSGGCRFPRRRQSPGGGGEGGEEGGRGEERGGRGAPPLVPPAAPRPSMNSAPKRPACRPSPVFLRPPPSPPRVARQKKYRHEATHPPPLSPSRAPT